MLLQNGQIRHSEPPFGGEESVQVGATVYATDSSFRCAPFGMKTNLLVFAHAIHTFECRVSALFRCQSMVTF